MDKRLCSVGLDVGTTTTQLVVSELTVENRASAFAVPEMDITRRTVRHYGKVHPTPLLGHDRVDGAGIRALVEAEYAAAGIRPEDVDTGAVIITGETSRKENARQVLEALSSFAGDFVVATAGPHLESVLAAKGAGAVAYSQQTETPVLHMDIGGGTTNLALIRQGQIRATGCLNVGGRLLKVDGAQRLTYLSPVLKGLSGLKPGEILTREQAQTVAGELTQVLEMAAGLRPRDRRWERLVTREAEGTIPFPPGAILSFSGGVAACIRQEVPDFAYGDMGPVLGSAIRRSRLCQGPYRLAEQPIRATVIGAGCHSARLSGSTVFFRGTALPVKNLPVAAVSAGEQTDAAAIRRSLAQVDGDTPVLAIPGIRSPDYGQLRQIAAAVAEGMAGRPIFVCVERDMAKALGQCLCLMLPKETPCLCIDGIRLSAGSFLDVGMPIGPALPVVVKTLILSQ